jgi:hypothetical protein
MIVGDLRFVKRLVLFNTQLYYVGVSDFFCYVGWRSQRLMLSMVFMSSSFLVNVLVMCSNYRRIIRNRRVKLS